MVSSLGLDIAGRPSGRMVPCNLLLDVGPYRAVSRATNLRSVTDRQYGKSAAGMTPNHATSQEHPVVVPHVMHPTCRF